MSKKKGHGTPPEKLPPRAKGGRFVKKTETKDWNEFAKTVNDLPPGIGGGGGSGNPIDTQPEPIVEQSEAPKAEDQPAQEVKQMGEFIFDMDIAPKLNANGRWGTGSAYDFLRNMPIGGSYHFKTNPAGTKPATRDMIGGQLSRLNDIMRTAGKHFFCQDTDTTDPKGVGVRVFCNDQVKPKQAPRPKKEKAPVALAAE